MKKITLLIICITSLQLSIAQNSSVEKSINGIQTGFFGIYGYNESKLSNELTLRTELGLDMGITIDNGSSSNISFAPIIRLEPRWYYNLEKRIKKGKKITRNTGNFLSLNFSYNPDLFVIDFKNKNVTVPNQISIIPTWGIRRSLGKYFSYETGIGIGYRQIFRTKLGLATILPYSEVAVNLHLRIGFDF